MADDIDYPKAISALLRYVGQEALAGKAQALREDESFHAKVEALLGDSLFGDADEQAVGNFMRGFLLTMEHTAATHPQLLPQMVGTMLPMLEGPKEVTLSRRLSETRRAMEAFHEAQCKRGAQDFASRMAQRSSDRAR